MMNSLLKISAIAALTSAHVIMIEPHPYNLDTEPLYQTWPLSADLPFPCQGRSQHAEKVTKVTAGTNQLVKFWGSAVHGGGSCQFSVAYGDAPPDDPEAWHNIYSIIGGCPAEAQGNIPTTQKDPHGREHGPECGNDSGTECIRQFEIPISKEMKNGPAVFAWTWFNKIGNREMYMVCSPIEIVGGAEDQTFIDGLPAIFRANIPGECTTGPSGNVINFPEPGDFGVVLEPAGPGSSGSCPEGVEPDFKDGDAPAKPEKPSPSAPSSEQPSEAPVASSVPPVLPPAPSSAANTTATRVQQTETPTPTPTAPGVPANSSVPDWVVGMKPCPESGMLICLSPTTFGICNHGWAVPQDVAAGTKCVDGRIVHEN
ncbi:hypothetical protein ACJ41O_000184 [Fusarium nematophilum]